MLLLPAPNVTVKSKILMITSPVIEYHKIKVAWPSKLQVLGILLITTFKLGSIRPAVVFTTILDLELYNHTESPWFYRVENCPRIRLCRLKSRFTIIYPERSSVLEDPMVKMNRPSEPFAIIL